MALLDAFSRWSGNVAAVATFDHGTGEAATRATVLVRAEAARRGLDVHLGRRTAAGPASEAMWRSDRWSFLREVASSLEATVVTAHTQDDQLETVVIRALRDARHTGARGLAAMYASSGDSPIARPLLHVSRNDVGLYVAAHAVPYVEDPSNGSRAFLRNRIRMDLLPALEREAPGFSKAMLGLASRAARWRAEIDAVVDDLGATRLSRGTLVVPAYELRRFDPSGLAVLWPALADRVGVVLDRRGTERLVAFTTKARRAGRVPLSGGARVECTGGTFVLTASPVRE